MPSASAAQTRWPAAVGFALLVVAGAAARLLASRGCLWLDEIWSLMLVKGLSSPLPIFTTIRSSNNNHLNTLALYLLGAHWPWFVYRLPAVAAGLGAILVAGHIGGKRGRLEALLAVLLTADSYLLIYYSSEARGYALAVFFNLAAFDLLDDYLRHGGSWKLAGYWVVAMLGLLSQVMLWLLFYPALVAWSVVRICREGGSWSSQAGKLVTCHAVPGAAFVALYLMNLRDMVVGEGPPYRLVDVLSSAASLAAGGPESGRGVWLATTAMIAVTLAGIWLLRRQRSDTWVFYLCAIGLCPLTMALGKTWLLPKAPDVLFVRYFTSAAAFFLVLMSFVLADLGRKGTWGKVALGVALAGFIASNAWQTAQLVRFGRGDYFNAVRDMAAESPGATIRVGSDQEFRSTLLLGYYSEALPGVSVRYYPETRGRRVSWAKGGPQWYIVHRFEEGSPSEGIVVHGAPYALWKRYRHAGLSGWDWFVYERALQHNQ